jgi:hypothetical protein
LSGAAALSLSGLVGAIALYGRPDSTPEIASVPAAAPAIRPISHARQTTSAKIYGALLDPDSHMFGELVDPGLNVYGQLFDPGFDLGSAPQSFAASHPLGSNFAGLPPRTTEVVAEAEAAVPSAEEPAAPDADAGVPLPAPRPAHLGFEPGHVSLRSAARQLAQQNQTVASATPADNRSFFDKLFGAQQQTGPVLAYAAQEGGEIGNERKIASGIGPGYDHWTAVYNIAAHTVYMPDGTTLEAHSGLGETMDDPHAVNERMRGPTPPAVYALQPREQLFHGVQALRLIPVGDGDTFGRTGLLAHSYMLGPYGASNGCVSFKDYNAFLQAYMKGEIKRLVVVAGL